MLADELALAIRHRGYPAVTLLVDLKGTVPWGTRLERLQVEARRRLADEFGRSLDPDLVRRLSTLPEVPAGSVGERSLAVFVRPGATAVVQLPVPVRDRVVVDDTFATRDLVHAVNRSQRYWVVVLDPQRPRLLRGIGTLLEPVPFEVPADAGASAGAERGPARTDQRSQRRDRRLREIDKALALPIAGDDDALVLVGVEPTVSRFEALCRHRDRIEAVVRRSPDGPLRELVPALAQHLDEVFERRCSDALASLERHLAGGRAVLGLEQVWHAAQELGGATIVVEQGYEQPGRLGDDGALELVPPSERDTPDVIDDVVDDLVEHVLARGGQAHVVPDGSLADRGRVALLSRHRLDGALSLSAPSRPARSSA